MQQEELRLAVPGMPAVQPPDALHGRVQPRAVIGQRFGFRVGHVRQQGEVKVVDAVGHEAYFEVVEETGGGRGGPQQGRHDHDGPMLRRDSAGEVQAGQETGRNREGDDPVDQRHGGAGERRPGDGKQRHGGRINSAGGDGGQRDGRQRDRRRRDGEKIPRQRPPADQAAEAPAQGKPASEPRFQRLPIGVDQKEAHMALAPLRALAPALRRHGDGRFRRLDLGAAALPGQFLDSVPVAVSRPEIHEGVDARRVAAEHGLGDAERLDEIPPVDGRQGPHAGNAVAGGDVIGRLRLVLALLDLLDGLPAVGQLLFQPVEREPQGGVDAVDVGDQLGDEGRRQGRVRPHEISQRGDELAGGVPEHLEKSFGPQERRVPLATPPSDALGDPVQVLDERQAQHDRDGPQLAQGEGLHLLVRLHETAEVLEVDLPVGMPHQLQHGVVNPGEALARPGFQPGQGAAVAGGKVGPRQLDLFLDQVAVVKEPFGGRRDAAAQPHAAGDGFVAAADAALALRELVEQALVPAHHRRVVARREDARVVHELAHAEQLGAAAQLLLRRLGAPGNTVLVGQAAEAQPAP